MDKVLILIRDTDHANMLQSELNRMHQFAVSIVNQAEEAFALFKKIKFSVFVTDISPPGIDLLELLSYMTQQHPNLPCIIMTDHGKPWFKEQMAKQSFLYHLEKPFKVSSLVSAIIVGLSIRDEGNHLQGMTMASVLPLIEILQKTCRMEARSTDQNKGYLYFNEGVLIDAHHKDLRGESAAREIAKWKRITIKFSELPQRRTRARVKTNLMDIAGACWDKSQVVLPPSDHSIIPLTQEVESKNSHAPTRQKVPSARPIEKSDKVIPISTEPKTTRDNANDSPIAVAREKRNQTVTETHTIAEIDRKTPVPSEPEKNRSDTPELLLDDLSVDLPEKPEITEETTRHLNKNYTLSEKSGIAKDMYLEYFQLIQKPFQINTDPSFLWLGEKQKEALATLTYGLQENKGFLLFTGDVGVGKTTIVKAMLQELGQNDLAVVINNPIMESLDFFNYVARSFGLSGKYISKGAFLEAFGDFLLTSHYKGKRVLLIIDECQLLDSSLLNEIRLFLNFEKKGTLLINVFFVGQLEFKKMLLQPENRAIRQRIAVSYNIPPLSLKETEKYIEYRLAVAGNSKKIFKAAAIREIYNFSKGYPRLINIIADRALLTGYINSARHIKKGIIKECAEELDFSAINKNQ